MAPDGTVEYIINSAVWSAVGAGGSMLYCRNRERVPTPMAERPRPRFNLVTTISLIILVFAVISTVVSIESDRRQRDFVTCQARVNQARTDALNELFLIGAQDRSAVDAMVLAVTDSKSEAQTRAALSIYANTRRTLEIERKAHPLPQPDNLCGSVPK